MKKQMIWKIILLVLPLVVVMIASNPTSIMVYDGETLTYTSWLETVPNSNVGWCAPAAVLMNYGLFALAVFYALREKEGCLKAMSLLALAAACLAVMPIMVQSDLKIVPNVFGAIVLGAEGIVARVVRNTSAGKEKEKSVGSRIKR